jgi:putative addiction module killer protein
MAVPVRPREVRQSADFARWLGELADVKARARVDIRIRRLALGNFGDAKALGGGLSELRIDYGPGFRVYFAIMGETVVLLLTGGDKRRQSADILRARTLLAEALE